MPATMTTEPTAPDVVVPELSTMAPELPEVVDAPVTTVTPPDGPTVTVDLPVSNDTEPDFPVRDTPDASVTGPELPAAVVPELRVMDPLAPVATALAVDTYTAPEEEDAPAPEVTYTFPPDDSVAEDWPANITRDPPAPELVEPMMMLMGPPAPPVA